MTAVPATAEAPLPRKTVVVVALGITQILAWGSTFELRQSYARRPHRSPSIDHLEGKESQPPI